MERVRVHTESDEQTIVPDEGGTLKCRKWPHGRKLSPPGLNCLSQGEPMKVLPLMTKMGKLCEQF